MKKNKIRTDELLCKQDLCADIETARKKIMAGLVRVGNDYLVHNPSEKFSSETALTLGTPCKYVSRGAFKLIPALDKYIPDLHGKTAVDIGASTGGFTDLMLNRGIEKVYAVDVGYGQMHLRLRQDSRVVCMERVNARYFTENSLPEKVDVMTMDVSFISVTKLLKAVNTIMKPDYWAFILIKPQFEAERKDIEKGGVVRKQHVRDSCILKVKTFVENILDWTNLDVITSPILGPKGNQEYILVKIPN